MENIVSLRFNARLSLVSETENQKSNGLEFICSFFETDLEL